MHQGLRGGVGRGLPQDVGGDLDGLVEDVLELRHDSGEDPLLDHGLALKCKQANLIQHTHVAEEAEYRSLEDLPLGMGLGTIISSYYSVTTVLHKGYYSVTTVLLQCYYSVTTVLHKGYYSVTQGLLQCYNSVTQGLLQCYNSVTTVLLQCSYSPGAWVVRWVGGKG